MAVQNGYLLFEQLESLGWLRHCFTTRAFEDSTPRADRHRAGLAGRLRDEYFPSAQAVVWGEQVHGSGVAVIREPAEGFTEITGTDALICGVPGVCLTAFGADCPLVYIADRETGPVALVHSGRKGTEAGIITACLEEMRGAFKISPEDCLAAISPSIGPCCYAVDLWAGIEAELTSFGVRTILNPRLCTCCHSDLFFSYRRERGQCGRMLGAIMSGGKDSTIKIRGLE
jgi:copper oxidase (laccase) domain-containing protein